MISESPLRFIRFVAFITVEDGIPFGMTDGVVFQQLQLRFIRPSTNGTHEWLLSQVYFHVILEGTLGGSFFTAAFDMTSVDGRDGDRD